MLNEIKIEGPGATITCVDNAIRGIHNRKLPAEYQSSADLYFHDERVALHLNDNEFNLVPHNIKRVTISSQVREGRVRAESDSMHWVPIQDIDVSRKIHLTHCDLSRVQISMRFCLQNQCDNILHPSLEWKMTLPSCIPFGYDHQRDDTTFCSLDQGDLPRSLRQQGILVFSIDSKRINSRNNRLLVIKFNSVKPYKVSLSRDSEDRQCVKARFGVELPAHTSQEISIDLIYRVLLPNQMSNTIFLVARPKEHENTWQGAVAAATSWIDRLETSSDSSFSGTGFRRFAPFLWFDKEKPLPDQILRFLHNMSSLQRIIVFGEVLPHDLENLLTALLDKGTDQSLRLQVFTIDEYYRDRVNVLRGNIQARMIIADEQAGRVRRLEEIIFVTVVSNFNLMPLALRHFMETVNDDDLFVTPVHDQSAILIPADAPETPLLAVASAPIARHLAAPVLLWNRATEREILQHLKKQKLKRLFLIGHFTDTEEAAIYASLAQENDTVTDEMITTVRIPYQDPITASSVLARLFKAHLLIDWLVQNLRMEQFSIYKLASMPITEITREYIDVIKQKPWANNIVQALQSVIDGELSNYLTVVYQDAFVGSNEFIDSFKSHFHKAAENRQDLLATFAPIWDDMVVLCDFTLGMDFNLNIFPAACFAAYHEAPLLLFPAISEDLEQFITQRVRELERRSIAYHTTRNFVPAVARKFADSTQDLDLARLVFPWDIQTTLLSLNPMSIALYSSNTKVPYEAISDQLSPMSLKYVVGHLGGTDVYDTSLITASGMLYAHEMQRHDSLNILLCFAELPDLPPLDFEAEEQVIREALKIRGEHFTISTLKGLEDLKKKRILEKLGEPTHIFHYGGHGYESIEWPQRSGIFLYEDNQDKRVPLNALEIKYRVRLGAHPIVFLNGCFASSNNRIILEEEEEKNTLAASQTSTDETTKTNENSQTAKNSQQIMGVSSSFIHIGAAAVMAPLWEIMDTDAIQYARYWYTYLVQGCSIGEAALLAKLECVQSSEQNDKDGKGKIIRFGVLSYIIHGDPTLRLYPLQYLMEHHPETALRLLQLKRTLL